MTSVCESCLVKEMPWRNSDFTKFSTMTFPCSCVQPKNVYMKKCFTPWHGKLGV